MNKMDDDEKLISDVKDHTDKMDDDEKLISDVRDHTNKMDDDEKLISDVKDHTNKMDDDEKLINDVRDHTNKMDDDEKLINDVREHTNNINTPDISNVREHSNNIKSIDPLDIGRMMFSTEEIADAVKCTELLFSEGKEKRLYITIDKLIDGAKTARMKSDESLEDAQKRILSSEEIKADPSSAHLSMVVLSLLKGVDRVTEKITGDKVS